MPSQPYDLTIEGRPTYLYACLQAEFISLEIAVQYINELMAHLRTTGYDRVLFVRDTPSAMSKTHYAIVASVIANMLPQHIKFAVVDRSPSHAVIKGTLLQEREEKHRNINAFDSFDEAEEWLLGDAA